MCLARFGCFSIPAISRKIFNPQIDEVVYAPLSGGSNIVGTHNAINGKATNAT
jgi:hypothetical protein